MSNRNNKERNNKINNNNKRKSKKENQKNKSKKTVDISNNNNLETIIPIDLSNNNNRKRKNMKIDTNITIHPSKNIIYISCFKKYNKHYLSLFDKYTLEMIDIINNNPLIGNNNSINTFDNSLNFKNVNSLSLITIEDKKRQDLSQLLDIFDNNYINNNSFYNNFESFYSNNNKLINNPDKPYNSFQDFKYSRRKDFFKTSPYSSLPAIKKTKVKIEVELNNIKDILDLIEKYPLKSDVEYNINMRAIHNIKNPLIELNNMIGMNKLKNNVVNQIIYFIQELHKCSNNKSNFANDFMHTVIYGPPGTGKTEIAKIMGKIYSKMGVLKKGTFTKATRSDLIAGYLGQTALKTTEMVNKSLGGVLFIDEAYALGNSEKRDSFAKECIDTLCEALSEHKNELMVIIAGYENDLKQCFFNYNPGLESRFTWRFKTDDYSHKELKEIYVKKISDAGWSLKKENCIKDSWFEKHMEYFKYYGRDMETLFSKTKIAHARRVFCLDEKEKTKITMKDVKKGFEMYLENDEVKNRKSQIKELLHNMYV